MIFQQYLDVIDGTKTQTRRVVKEGEQAENSHGMLVPGHHWDQGIDSVYTPKGYKKWQRGGDYAIQAGRGGRSLGRFRIERIRIERLQDITEEDAKAEGFDSIDDFRILWTRLYARTKGYRWSDNPLVWCLSLESLTNL